MPVWVISLTAFPSFNVAFSLGFWVWTIIIGPIIALKLFKHA
jgi:hypothetical protein